MSPHNLLHSKGMNNLRSIVSKLSSLLGGDNRDETSSDDLARVRGEDTIDLFPDLELVGVKSNGEKRGAEVGVSATNRGEERAGNDSEVAGYDGETVAAGFDALGKVLCKGVVEFLVQGAFGSVGGGDDVLEVDVFRVDTLGSSASSPVSSMS
jgi:hypothetical protein